MHQLSLISFSDGRPVWAPSKKLQAHSSLPPPNAILVKLPHYFSMGMPRKWFRRIFIWIPNLHPGRVTEAAHLCESYNADRLQEKTLKASSNQDSLTNKARYNHLVTERAAVSLVLAHFCYMKFFHPLFWNKTCVNY